MISIALLLALSTPPSQTAPADASTPVDVRLAPGDASSGRLRWSPKGAKVSLSPDGDALVGRFPLGPVGAPEIGVRLARTEGAAHFDRLWVDVDRDGVDDEGEWLATSVSEQRGKWWTSAQATLTVPSTPVVELRAGDGGDGAAVARPYPVSLWFVEDPFEPDAAPALRWSRRGWHEGECVLDGRPAWVLITEMEMDGVFDQRDAWALARDRDALLSAPSRGMESHAWLDGAAYRVTSIDPDGARVGFAPYDPGMTEAEERERSDATAVDRAAPRAATPLAFGADLTAAMAEAKASGRRVFVDFQTTWCGPCRTMEQLVYTADEVVKAAAGTIAVKLDGDVERELTRRYGVTAYPTMLLLDADGAEVRRLVGYQHVADMARFLRAE